MTTEDPQLPSSSQQPIIQLEGILSNSTQPPGEGVGLAGDVSATALVRSPLSLLLSDGFNILNVEHDIGDSVDVNAIALGAHPIGDDD